MTAHLAALVCDDGMVDCAAPSRPPGTAPSSQNRSVDSADLRKGPTVADDILTLSDATFDETVAGSDTPVLVDFWAEWCGPCKMIAPTLAEIATEQRGKLTIGKLNVDDNPDTARRFDVMSIPTLLVFKDGQQVKRLVGAKGKGQLLQDLAEFIA
jgi:thioredoxin 1